MKSKEFWIYDNPGGGWDRELWRNEQKLAESAYQKLLDAKVEVKS